MCLDSTECPVNVCGKVMIIYLITSIHEIIGGGAAFRWFCGRAFGRQYKKLSVSFIFSNFLSDLFSLLSFF